MAADDGPVENVERSEQRGLAVTVCSCGSSFRRAPVSAVDRAGCGLALGFGFFSSIEGTTAWAVGSTWGPTMSAAFRQIAGRSSYSFRANYGMT